MKEMEELKNKIEKYVPYNKQEECDKKVMFKYINDFLNILMILIMY